MKPYNNLLLFRNRSKRILRVQIELVLLDSDDVHFICGYVSTLGKLYFFRFRCVRLGEDPMSDISRKQICETRTVAEREYKVNICWHLRSLSLPDHLQNYLIATLYGKCQQIYNETGQKDSTEKTTTSILGVNRRITRIEVHYSLLNLILPWDTQETKMLVYNLDI